jgi:hypothetical protein
LWVVGSWPSEASQAGEQVTASRRSAGHGVFQRAERPGCPPAPRWTDATPPATAISICNSVERWRAPPVGMVCCNGANQGCIGCIIKIADEHVTRGVFVRSCDDDERAIVGLCRGSAGTSQELASTLPWQLTMEVTAAPTSRAGLGTVTVGGAWNASIAGFELAFEAVAASFWSTNPGKVAGGGRRLTPWGDGWTVFEIPSTPWTSRERSIVHVRPPIAFDICKTPKAPFLVPRSPSLP